MANEVTLTFAGDSAKLEKAFDNVGAAASKMDRSIKDSSKVVDEHANHVESLGEKADGAETSLIGVHDVVDGLSTVMQGPGKAGITGYIQGWADLAGGAAPLLLQLGKLRVATVAQTVAQWAQNAAWLASPITWIVAGILLVVAAVVLIATKTDWFQKGWRAAWGGIKAAASAVADWFKGPFVGFFQSAWNKLTGMPDALRGAFSKVTGFLLAPFRAAFNGIATAWNSTVGRLSFHIPSWVPGIGGDGFDVPNIPKFHTGGVVPGAPGQEMLAILQAGETITPAGASTGGGSIQISFGGNTDGAFATAFMNLVRGGQIQIGVA